MRVKLATVSFHTCTAIPAALHNSISSRVESNMVNAVRSEPYTPTRRLSAARKALVLPQNNVDLFATLCSGKYRQSYDDAIDKTDNLKRICANVKVLYQKSKKIMMGLVSARDFVIIQYNHVVSLFWKLLTLCLARERRHHNGGLHR